MCIGRKDQFFACLHLFHDSVENLWMSVSGVDSAEHGYEIKVFSAIRILSYVQQADPD